MGSFTLMVVYLRVQGLTGSSTYQACLLSLTGPHHNCKSYAQLTIVVPQFKIQKEICSGIKLTANVKEPYTFSRQEQTLLVKGMTPL